MLRRVCILLILWTVTGQPAGAERVPARERLQKALEVSRDLAAKASEIDQKILERAHPAPAEYLTKQMQRHRPNGQEETVSGKVFLTPSQIVDYETARPWSRFYRTRRENVSARNPNFPAKADAPALRELLTNKDSGIRSLACEALAVLELPEDVPRIAALMEDTAEGAPSLEWNEQLSATFGVWNRRDINGPVIFRSFRKLTVSDYARRSVLFMTGEWLDAKTFPKWWNTHSDAINCLWYWQQRIEHAAREIDDSFGDVDPAKGETKRDFTTWKNEAEKKKFALAEEFSRELRRELPETEAKVKLLAYYESYDTSINPEDIPTRPFFKSPLDLRIKPERLLELLEGKNLWSDIDWNSIDGYDNRLRVRIAMSTKGLTRKHVERLRAVLATKNREGFALWRDDRAALVMAISRLLPPAEASNLDNPETRDGTLRMAIRDEKQTFSRTYVAMELVRVGLPMNWPFLKETFFDKPDKSTIPDVGPMIIRALGEAPLTQKKREALVDLLLDERFRLFWTRPNSQMGYDMCREEAIMAVNAHAGRELISDQESYALVDPAKSQGTLEGVLDKVRSLR